jgi:hypothetical protein
MVQLETYIYLVGLSVSVMTYLFLTGPRNGGRSRAVAARFCKSVLAIAAAGTVVTIIWYSPSAKIGSLSVVATGLLYTAAGLLKPHGVRLASARLLFLPEVAMRTAPYVFGLTLFMANSSSCSNLVFGI